MDSQWSVCQQRDIAVQRCLCATPLQVQHGWLLGYASVIDTTAITRGSKLYNSYILARNLRTSDDIKTLEGIIQS
jgi:hypothetical protein